MASLLITGANGFVGNTLIKLLQNKFEITTLGLNSNNKIVCDLSKNIPNLEKNIKVVIHAAGKAHSIPRNEIEALEFQQVNLQGTLNLLNGLSESKSKVSQFIFLSTVAVYGIDNGLGINEDWPLNGSTPYAKSKIMAEDAVISWCTRNNVKYIILRLPLVVGEKAPGNLGAIKKAIAKGHYFRISGNHARKSVVLAEDVALLIASLDDKQGVFNLTDGVHPSFHQIEESIAKQLGKAIHWTLPLVVAKILAKVGDVFSLLKINFPLNSDKLKKLTSSLTFDDKAAREILGWKPNPAF